MTDDHPAAGMSNPMEPTDPMEFLKGGSPRCKATAKQTGNRCGNAALPGATTCRFHGSATPAARRSARLRLLELVDPAISTMSKIMNNPEAKEADRLRAAENILDRAGYPRAVQVDSDGARELLKQRILAELAKRAADEQDRLVGQALEVVEGTVVEDEETADGAEPQGDQP